MPAVLLLRIQLSIMMTLVHPLVVRLDAAVLCHPNTLAPPKHLWVLKKASCLILLQISTRCMILGPMVRLIHFLLALLTSSLRTRLSLQLEIAALRHQLSVYRAKSRRARIAPVDRLLWSVVARLWSGWRRALFIVHFDVTEHPTAQGTAQQLVEAFPFDTAPRYLIRDGDGIYGPRVTRRIESLGIDEVVTAPGSPWQNAYVERVIGSLRRELLDHVIILNERHLKRLLSSYLDYYHPWRTHRSLDRDAPDGRPVRSAEPDHVMEFPAVQGLHHYYLPKAA